MSPTKDDREDFAGFCRNATDSQVIEIYKKEKAANRQVYAAIAKEEAVRRGLM
jgi:hypothetical protein